MQEGRVPRLMSTCYAKVQGLGFRGLGALGV